MARLGLVRAATVVGFLGALAGCGSDFSSSSAGEGGAAGVLSSGGAITDETGGADSAGAGHGIGGGQVVGAGGRVGSGTGGEPAAGGSGTGGEVGSGGSGTGGEVGSGGTVTGGETASGGSGTGGEVGSGGSGSGGLTGDWGHCQVNSDCVVRPESCCGECGAATRDDIIALNENELDEYQATVCDAAVGCDPCYQATDPFLGAMCDGGHCEVFDLRASPITECVTSEDCRVRAQECCECGATMTQETLIAINVGQEAAYAALVCDPNTTCLECAPAYPDAATAVCVGDSEPARCDIVWAGVNGTD